MEKKLTIGLFLLILIFIWAQSTLPPDLSSAESGWVMNLVRPFLEIFVGKGKVTHHMVRKLAHFTEFGLLGFISFFVFEKKNRKLFLQILFGSILSLCVALIDEGIQIFTGRGPSFTDVGIDFSGALTGVLFAVLIKLCVRHFNSCKH